MRRSKDTWVCSHHTDYQSGLVKHYRSMTWLLSFTDRQSMFIFTVERWWLRRLLKLYLQFLTITLERRVVLQMDGMKYRGEHIRLTDHVQHSAEHQTLPHCMSEDSKWTLHHTDSTHWHYNHSSLGQPWTHCHHTPYATIGVHDKEQMDWYSVCSAFATWGNVHKTLLFTCTQSTHVHGYTQTDTQLQFQKGTIVCTADIFITAPFRYIY